MAAINDMHSNSNPESRLTALIKEKIAKLPDLPENPCIYKIPKNLRSAKEKAYTPYRVAIGPYHADDPALMPMNHYKLKCLDSLISWNTKLRLEDCVKEITPTQDDARKYYADIEYLSSDDFVQMLLIDGAFIIKFILCIVGLITDVDVVFTKKRIVSEIIRDLIVLENQLPFFILDHLYKLICDEKIKAPFILVVYDVLSGMVPFKTGSNRLVEDDIFRRIENVQVMHLVHFMRLCCMPLPLQKENDVSALSTVHTRDDESNTEHFMRLCCMPLPLQKENDVSALSTVHTRDDESNTEHFMRLCCMPLPLQKEIDVSALSTVHTRDDESNTDMSALTTVDTRDDESNTLNDESDTLYHQFLSATELHEVGVKIKKIASDKHLLEMKFSGGVLEIPHLRLHEFTEMFFRNIMAFEQYYLNTYEVTSYMYFMDRLVDTTKDVQILQRGDIIENCLESKDIATAVFDPISKHTISNYTIACDATLQKMCKDMNGYARRPFNRWMAMLRRDYLGSPWAIISFLAALLLLVLTSIQTVVSVLQDK